MASQAQQVSGFVLAVAKALGIATERVQRVVIDANVLGGPVKVYVKTLPVIGADEVSRAGEVVAAALGGCGSVEVVVAPDLVVTPTGVSVGPQPTPIEERILAEQKRMLDALDQIQSRLAPPAPKPL